MKYRVVIQPPARLEIDAAYVYLSERSVAVAERWLSGLETAIRSLEKWPLRSGLAPESREFAEKIRHLIYGKRTGRYRVLYVVRGVTVRVLHVRHGVQKPLSPDELET
jgi:plasmid stabilization system protein ParE